MEQLPLPLRPTVEIGISKDGDAQWAEYFWALSQKHAPAERERKIKDAMFGWQGKKEEE